MSNRINIEKLKEESKNALSIADLCRRMGIRPCGGNYVTIKKHIKLNDINISHFTGKAWNQGTRYKPFGKTYTLEEILVENSTYVSTHKLKNRLFKEGLKQKKCEICGTETWNNKELSFELHHVNGDNMDNRIENLKIICPNCHSQTEEYRGKNKNRSKRNDILTIERKKEEKIIKIKTPKIKKYIICKVCGNEIKKRRNKVFCSTECSEKYKSRNIPSKEQLIIDFESLKSFTKVGKKYGVTDNAVRKWKTKYNI